MTDIYLLAPYQRQTSDMGLFAGLERTVQGTANVATTSGLDAMGFTNFIASQLPGPIIDHGFTNLRAAATELQQEVVPADVEKLLYKEHDRLFEMGLGLRKDKKSKSGLLAFRSLRNDARDFEDKTLALRGDVQTTSDYHRSNIQHRYTPSVHSVASSWVMAEVPASLVLSPISEGEQRPPAGDPSQHCEAEPVSAGRDSELTHSGDSATQEDNIALTVFPSPTCSTKQKL